MGYGILLAPLVSIANVSLNKLAIRAGRASDTYVGCVLSWEFATAFVAGMVSLLLLLAFYRTGENLAQGIVVMGAISIVLGLVWGHLEGNRLGMYEWVLAGLLAVFYLVRFVKLA